MDYDRTASLSAPEQLPSWASGQELAPPRDDPGYGAGRDHHG